MRTKTFIQCSLVAFFSSWFALFSRPAYAGDFDGTLFLLFSLFIYPPLFLVGLIFHIRFILKGVYRKRENLMTALIVINVFALAGYLTAAIFMDGSVFITTCFICFWGALVVIPLYQYWSHEKLSNPYSVWTGGLKWMVLGTALFSLIIAITLYRLR